MRGQIGMNADMHYSYLATFLIYQQPHIICYKVDGQTELGKELSIQEFTSGCSQQDFG